MKLKIFSIMACSLFASQAGAETLAVNRYDNEMSVPFIQQACINTPEEAECTIMQFGCEEGPPSLTFYETDPSLISKWFASDSFPEADVVIQGKSQKITKWQIKSFEGLYSHQTDFYLDEIKEPLTNALKNEEKIYITVGPDTFTIDPKTAKYDFLLNAAQKCFGKYPVETYE